MYILYKIDQISDIQYQLKIDENLFVRKIKPRIQNLHSLLWTIFSLGKFSEYQLVNESGHVLSSSQVMPKIFIFSFMDKEGIHIGPCFTNENYRGKGYFPYLLSMILKDFKDKKVYIFCDSTNTSSQRGILKAGFISFAIGYKTRLGIYKILK